MPFGRRIAEQIEPSHKLDLSPLEAEATLHEHIVVLQTEMGHLELALRNCEERAQNLNDAFDESPEEEYPSLRKRIVRKEQQLASTQYGNILAFADEIDITPYVPYIGVPSELGYGFNLRRREHPPTDPERAARLLGSLPFVHRKEIVWPDPRHLSLIIRGPLEFPTERIISVHSFDSWAGRGSLVYDAEGRLLPWRISDGGGGKSFTPNYLTDVEQTSRGAITDYAQSPVPGPQELESGACITLVRDSANQFWGYASNNGSHRLGAAKLRSEPTVSIEQLVIHALSDTPTVPFDVVTSFF